MEKIINQNNSFYKDYGTKISKKINIVNQEESEAINSLIIVLNYSFFKQNNFFVENFNKKNVINVCTSYNQLKTNILSPLILDIFNNISTESLKMFRFIINNYINNFEQIENNNKELCGMLLKESLINCSKKLTEQIKIQSY